MTVLVIDGCGNCFADCTDRAGAMLLEKPPNEELEQLYFEKDSYYEYRGNAFRTVCKDFSPFGPQQRYPMHPGTSMHSIGGAYLGVSQYVFRGMEDPGKLMGLAPYGRPNVYSFDMFTLRDGRVFLNYDWMSEFDRPARDAQEFKQNFQYYADVAWWAQRQIERALLYVVESRYETCAAENLGYAGRVALNAVANRLIRTQSRFKNLYIQPAAGDNGLAIGCAYYGWLQVLEGRRQPHNRSSSLGRRYSRDEVGSALEKQRARIEFVERPDIIEAAADLLVSGKVIAWFQGSSEFGPRALGHRSILALPNVEGVRDFINAKIKFREDFRPFAPSVLAEDAAVYFDQDYDSPYMILVAPIRAQWRDRMPAIVHRDGSCRVQTVHSEISPRYHSLHEALKRRDLPPVLLNTSLNRRGTPIVETPREAIQLLLETSLDALVMEDFVVLKRAVAADDDSVPVPSELFQSIAQAAAHDEARPASLGVMHFAVRGIEESWTLDLSGVPRCAPGKPAAPEYSVSLTARALRQLQDDPARIRQLCDSGEVQIHGSPEPMFQRAVCDRVAYLLRLVRQ
jgi:carbamoyltransferase